MGRRERVELIDGHVYAMAPAPSRIHQEILGNLYNEFANYLRGKRCRPYIAIFDVRLPKGNELDEEIDSVVKPDLSIVCDPEKLDDNGCKGAPDLIAEIISPSSLKLDTTAKKALYEQVGVKQYWIVYPHEKIVMVYTLKEEGRTPCKKNSSLPLMMLDMAREGDSREYYPLLVASQ